MIVRVPKAVDFNQGAVNVWCSSGKRHADHHATQFGVYQHAAVAIPPIERDQTVLAWTLHFGLGWSDKRECPYPLLEPHCDIRAGHRV